MHWNDYQDVTITTNGKEHQGRYRTDRAKARGIEVSYGSAVKYTLLHASSPETLARIMLRELVEEQERRS